MNWVYLWLLLLLVALIVGWAMTLLTLPGNWLIVAAAALYAWAVPTTSRWDIGWIVLVSLLVMALIGELLEFMTSAVGTKRAGGSRRAARSAIIGGMVGAICGALLGLPIPIVGSAIAAILGASLGAMIGAMMAEHSLGQPFAKSVRVGEGAFWGRLAGSVAKLAVGTLMVVVTIVALIVNAIVS